LVMFFVATLNRRIEQLAQQFGKRPDFRGVE
jgi:hypothetical protein